MNKPSKLIEADQKAMDACDEEEPTRAATRFIIGEMVEAQYTRGVQVGDTVKAQSK